MSIDNPIYRSTEFIELKQKTKSYIDVSLSFKPSPVTDDITLIRNEVSINNAIKNIIMFIPSEVPFNPDVGSYTQTYLFDVIDDTTAGLLAAEIQRAILFCEPRVTFTIPDSDLMANYTNTAGVDSMFFDDQLGVSVRVQPDQNNFEVTVKYRIVGEDQIFKVQQILTPTR